MGVLIKLVDVILLVFFTVIAVGAPLIDSQTCLPVDLFPKALVDLKLWYIREYDDYLFVEKPHFFVGLVWLELIFQWPLSIANVYGILAGKSWFGTTSLIYGASTLTSVVAILAELVLSKKASEKMMMLYAPFLGFAVLAILRGLVAQSGKTATAGRRVVLNRKKRA